MKKIILILITSIFLINLPKNIYSKTNKTEEKLISVAINDVGVIVVLAIITTLKNSKGTPKEIAKDFGNNLLENFEILAKNEGVSSELILNAAQQILGSSKTVTSNDITTLKNTIKILQGNAKPEEIASAITNYKKMLDKLLLKEKQENIESIDEILSDPKLYKKVTGEEFNQETVNQIKETLYKSKVLTRPKESKSEKEKSEGVDVLEGSELAELPELTEAQRKAADLIKEATKELEKIPEKVEPEKTTESISSESESKYEFEPSEEYEPEYEYEFEGF